MPRCHHDRFFIFNLPEFFNDVEVAPLRTRGTTGSRTGDIRSKYISLYQAHARSARAHRACALRALGLLLADRQPNFFTETAVTPERKVEKWFPRWEINRHAEG